MYFRPEILDSAASTESLASLADSTDAPSFSSVSGDDSGLLSELEKLSDSGVAISGGGCCYSLQYGGEVARNGNCLFEALAVALGGFETAAQVRSRCTARFSALVRSRQLPEGIRQRIANQYAPDLSSGWGVECVQEHKLLVRRADMSDAEAAIAERLGAGMDWTAAASSVYQELGRPVNDEESWAQYMALDGSDSDQHCIITLQCVEEGLLSVEHSKGQGAFGDDLAIEVLATEYQRDMYVVQAHGGNFDGTASLFFLPHEPLEQCPEKLPPVFLLMKGSDWRGAGADHYDPLIAQKHVSVENSCPYITL